MELLRICRVCDATAYTEEDLESFTKVENLCKKCKAANDKAYRLRNLDKQKQWNKDKYARLSAEEKVEMSKKQYARQKELYTPDELKERQYFRHTKHKYGVTEEIFYKMLEDQGNSCKVCGCYIDRSNINIDHNHETGEVRALLCCNCNALLGKSNDSPKLLRAALEYLETHSHYGL